MSDFGFEEFIQSGTRARVVQACGEAKDLVRTPVKRVYLTPNRYCNLISSFITAPSPKLMHMPAQRERG